MEKPVSQPGGMVISANTNQEGLLEKSGFKVMLSLVLSFLGLCPSESGHISV